MRTWLRKILPYLITAVCACLLGVFALAMALRPQTLDIGAVDLHTVSDGTYVGVCQNKILFAVVQVAVYDHRITDAEVLWHKTSYLPQANAVAASVVKSQSLDVDAISGATLTRATVLKAIENALLLARTK